MIYLASPYSHPDTAVREQRFEAACAAVAKLMAQGRHVFSPIVHNHPVAVRHELPVGWDFWKKVDTAFLRISSELMILKIEGWDKSVGVRDEVSIAQSLNIPVSEYWLDHQRG